MARHTLHEHSAGSPEATPTYALALLSWQSLSQTSYSSLLVPKTFGRPLHILGLVIPAHPLPSLSPY